MQRSLPSGRLHRGSMSDYTSFWIAISGVTGREFILRRVALFLFDINDFSLFDFHHVTRHANYTIPPSRKLHFKFLHPNFNNSFYLQIFCILTRKAISFIKLSNCSEMFNLGIATWEYFYTATEKYEL